MGGDKLEVGSGGGARSEPGAAVPAAMGGEEIMDAKLVLR